MSLERGRFFLESVEEVPPHFRTRRSSLVLSVAFLMDFRWIDSPTRLGRRFPSAVFFFLFLGTIHLSWLSVCHSGGGFFPSLQTALGWWSATRGQTQRFFWRAVPL